MLTSRVTARLMSLFPLVPPRGVCFHRFCMHCTPIHVEVCIQAVIVSSTLYADDTALVGLITNDEADYISSMDHFTTWCSDNCLEMNVSKTKEMIIDFRSGVHHPNPVNVMGQNIEIVHSYKYLVTIIDDKLRWDENTTNLYKKGQQRLYFLRKLNALHVDRNILSLFHDSFVKSVMTFGLICWWGNLSVKNRAKLSV